jgi:hypothetical protein
MFRHLSLRESQAHTPNCPLLCVVLLDGLARMVTIKRNLKNSRPFTCFELPILHDVGFQFVATEKKGTQTIFSKLEMS